MQTAVRICKATLFYLEQNADTAYRPNPRFLTPESTDATPITNKPQLLLWTHTLLRALQQRTWGEGERALLQLVSHPTRRDA